jgi:hypothetical protein
MIHSTALGLGAQPGVAVRSEWALEIDLHAVRCDGDGPVEARAVLGGKPLGHLCSPCTT